MIKSEHSYLFVCGFCACDTHFSCHKVSICGFILSYQNHGIKILFLYNLPFKLTTCWQPVWIQSVPIILTPQNNLFATDLNFSELFKSKNRNNQVLAAAQLVTLIVWAYVYTGRHCSSVFCVFFESLLTIRVSDFYYQFVSSFLKHKQHSVLAANKFLVQPVITCCLFFVEHSFLR